MQYNTADQERKDDSCKKQVLMISFLKIRFEDVEFLFGNLLSRVPDSFR